MRRYPRLALLLVVLLSGCAAPVRPPGPESLALWQARQARLATLDTWDLRGRLGVRAGDDGGQASLRWQRRGDRHELDLGAPLGRGMLRFSADATAARARDAEGRTYQAADLSTLVFNLTGWRIPVARLQYWVRGLAAPGAAAVPVLDEAGRLRLLEQAGWRVRIPDYMESGGFELPRRVLLSYPGDDSGVPPIELKLVIESWWS